MSLLKVCGDELTGLAGRLDSSSQRMDQVRRALDSANSAGLGSGELDGACEDFSGSWGYGVGRLGQCAGDASGFLHAAVRAFSETDQQLAQGLREGGD